MILRSSIALLACALACESGAAQQPAPAKPATLRQVVLHVNSESWIKGSSFPKAELSRRCSSAGIALSTAKGDLDVTIDYNEEKGEGYSLFGVGEPSAWGTGIDYHITILSADGAEKLADRWGYASSDSEGSSTEGLHQSARRMLIANKAFTETCSMIAALLGSHAEQAKLLQWAVSDDAGRKLLEKAGFEPKTPGETAWWLVAQGNFDQLAPLGAAAAPALHFYLKSFYDFDDGWDGNRAVRSPVEALRAYGALSDPNLNTVLSNVIEKKCCLGNTTKDVQKLALELARDKGNRSLLKPIASWRDSVQSSSYYKELQELLPLAEEARAAIASRS
jgi:hypothetical protein